MIFLVLSGNMIFVFPKNIVLFFRRKMKDDLSQKNAWKYDIFLKCSEKMVFPIFLVILSGKMIFPFPENMILFLRRKMKDDVSRKNRWKYDISFKSPEKIVFPKKSRLNMIFFVLFGKMVFFPGKYDIFPLDRK